ncbi:MAG: hypothetical protein RIS45_1586 [Planctomycetota bacterium]
MSAGWILTRDRLPESGTRVLAHWKSEQIRTVVFANGEWLEGWHAMIEPTHWMPLPNPPNHGVEIGPRVPALDTTGGIG